MAHPPGSAEELLVRCACELEHVEALLAVHEWRPMGPAAKSGDDVLLWGPRLHHIVAYFDHYSDPQFPWVTLDGPNYGRDEFTHFAFLTVPK